jgi:hypothetical protein
VGGGLAASFWPEAGLNNDNGTGVASSTDNQASGATGGQALTFNRRSTVSLSGRSAKCASGATMSRRS